MRRAWPTAVKLEATAHHELPHRRRCRGPAAWTGARHRPRAASETVVESPAPSWWVVGASALVRSGSAASALLGELGLRSARRDHQHLRRWHQRGLQRELIAQFGLGICRGGAGPWLKPCLRSPARDQRPPRRFPREATQAILDRRSVIASQTTADRSRGRPGRQARGCRANPRRAARSSATATSGPAAGQRGRQPGGPYRTRAGHPPRRRGGARDGEPPVLPRLVGTRQAWATVAFLNTHIGGRAPGARARDHLGAGGGGRRGMPARLRSARSTAACRCGAGPMPKPAAASGTRWRPHDLGALAAAAPTNPACRVAHRAHRRRPPASTSSRQAPPGCRRRQSSATRAG